MKTDSTMDSQEPTPSGSPVSRAFEGWRSPPVPGRRFRSWKDEGTAGLRGLLGILLQLLLVAGVIFWLNLESGRGLIRPVESWWQIFNPVSGGLLSLLILGFVIHAFLPLRWRMPFFLLLSLAGIILVMGWLDGGLLILFGLSLVALCHLPIPFAGRVVAILVAAVGFGLLRSGLVESPWASTVIPVLASLFMFRLIVYLYDLRNETAGVTPWQRLSYFFLAPNVCFPLFPVVDYTTFLRTWYDSRELQIYQKGVLWMSRGVVHLVLYRVIYQHFSPGPEEVDSLSQVVVFVISSYLLYLRISGQFHLIIGTLALFGFNLPETHHQYLLASGFSDYWRRINIYWRDFMMKLVFYPSFVRFKKLGQLNAIILGTLLVFFATWFLHGYQWFWLRGMIHFTLVDGLFWAFFALLVIINTVYELKKKKPPGKSGDRAKTAGFDLRHAVKISLQTAAMFTLICLLFSFWQSESITQFFEVLSPATDASIGEWATLLGWVILALAIGVLVPWVKYRLKGGVDRIESAPWLPVVSTAVPMILVAVLSTDWARSQAGEKAEPYLAALRESSLNARDQRRLDRGYYEGLLQKENFGSQLWEVRLEQKPDWQPMEGAGMTRLTGDLLHQELLPNQDLDVNGIRWVSNQWAMHDRDSYTKEKPPGTYRIALLSASYAAGYGMDREKTFENLAEDVLNEAVLTDDIERIEILNFSVPGYTLIEFVAFLDTRIAEFEPDAFFLVTHSKEGPRTLGTMTRRIKEKVPLVYPYLKSIKEQEEIPDEPTEQEVNRIFKYRDEIETWGYARMVEFCRHHDITPVWIFLPVTDEVIIPDKLAAMRGRAAEAGFITLSLDPAYGDGDPSAIWLSEHDRHPNGEGHRRISVRLIEELKAHAAEIGLPIKVEEDEDEAGSDP